MTDNDPFENSKLDEALSMFVQGIMDMKDAGSSMEELRTIAVAFASGIRRFASEVLVDDNDISLEALVTDLEKMADE